MTSRQTTQCLAVGGHKLHSSLDLQVPLFLCTIIPMEADDLSGCPLKKRKCHNQPLTMYYLKLPNIIQYSFIINASDSHGIFPFFNIPVFYCWAIAAHLSHYVFISLLCCINVVLSHHHAGLFLFVHRLSVLRVSLSQSPLRATIK